MRAGKIRAKPAANKATPRWAVTGWGMAISPIPAAVASVPGRATTRRPCRSASFLVAKRTKRIDSAKTTYNPLELSSPITRAYIGEKEVIDA